MASASSSALEEAIDVLLQLQDILPQKRGTVMRLADWFSRKTPRGMCLPMNPARFAPGTAVD